MLLGRPPATPQLLACAARGHAARLSAQPRPRGRVTPGRGDFSILKNAHAPGNPAGGPVGSRHRQQLNSEFLAALLRDFRQGGPKAIERVRRTQPAAYLKILALLVPREHKVEHSNPLKSLTDEELEAMVEHLKASLEAKAQSAKVIEGKAEVVPRLPSPAAPKPAL